MLDMKAVALRRDGVIEVTITGSLANSCVEARVKDIYPGGNIQYAADPGKAQVFIEEFKRPGAEICLMYLVPWVRSITIPADHHGEVEIIVNCTSSLTVSIQDAPTEFVVISLLGGADDAHEGCSIIPKGAPFPFIYRVVFGPATKSQCQQWVSQNCAAAMQTASPTPVEV